MDAVAQIGSAYWLPNTAGKLHTGPVHPLHPQLKAFIDDWLAQRPDATVGSALRRTWPRFSIARVDRGVARWPAAGIGHVHTSSAIRSLLKPSTAA